jgi:predicted phage terminase large subunit-like protein
MRHNDGFDEWTKELDQEFREQLEVAREVFESNRTPAEKAVWLELMAEGIDWPTIRFLIRAVRTEMAKLRAERAKAKEAEREKADKDVLEPASEARSADTAETLLDWGKRVLPEHFKDKPSGMHRWMGDQLDRMRTDRDGKLNVLGPRGAAKSTLATLAYPLREALERREAYIWLVSDTMEQAHDHLENLKAELLDNPRLAAAYPQAAGRGPIWRAGKIVLRNGVTIEALGTGQRIRGRRARANRPTLVVCDDLQNDRHMQSSLCRQNARTWFHGALLKAGAPGTNFVNLATALHRESLGMELHETPGWTSRVFRSIDPWPERMGLWEQWESVYADPHNPEARLAARAFYEHHREAMHAGAGVLWPEREDLYTLMCMRAEGGRSAFEREKQNSPVSPELCEWPESYFAEPLWFDQWPEGLRVKVLALDPSKGCDAKRHDYSAFVRLGVDRQGILYVEADLARRPIPQIIADGVEHYRQFRPDAFGVEANQFQELLGAQFEAEFLRQGMLGIHPWLIYNDTNKLVRLRRLSPHLAAHRIRLKANSPGTQLLLDQLRQFPTAEHDDGPDALEMALRLASEMFSNVPPDNLGSRLPVGRW